MNLRHDSLQRVINIPRTWTTRNLVSLEISYWRHFHATTCGFYTAAVRCHIL